ncbi:MAG TPA: hypothetical protein VM261_36820 [Kofleriaceae bacterium]|nr:hypothetical protein [Kofleriaceae bacterium]
MKILRAIALLGTVLGGARRAVRYWRERQQRTPREAREQPLFGDVDLPPVAESPRFPVAD